MIAERWDREWRRERERERESKRRVDEEFGRKLSQNFSENKKLLKRGGKGEERRKKGYAWWTNEIKDAVERKKKDH